MPGFFIWNSYFNWEHLYKSCLLFEQTKLAKRKYSQRPFQRNAIEEGESSYDEVWFGFVSFWVFFFILRFFSSIFVLLFHQLWCIFLVCLFKCWEPKCESNNFLRMNRIFEQRVLCLHLWLCSLKKRMLNWSQRRITHFMVNYFYSHSLDRWAHINDWVTLHPASISLKKKKKKKRLMLKKIYTWFSIDPGPGWSHLVYRWINNYWTGKET